MRKKSEKHQSFRKLASGTFSDDLGSINISLIWLDNYGKFKPKMSLQNSLDNILMYTDHQFS